MITSAPLSERIYRHSRRNLVWLIPLLLALAGYSIFNLVRAASSGSIFGRIVGQRRHILLADDPQTFWAVVVMNLVAVALVAGIILLLAHGRRLALRSGLGPQGDPPPAK